MPNRLSTLILAFCAAFLPGGRAETPPLLARAFAQWAAGHEDLAFTQQTRLFLDDGVLKQERVERYDPSLPDSMRWRLLEVDGRPATEAQRVRWESRKNGKPRRKVPKSPAEYLDMDRARLVGDTPTSARFEVGLRREAALLLAVQEIAIYITVDKESGRVARIAATLREPMRVLLGLARITDLAIDVRIETADADSPRDSSEVRVGSTARLTISELGDPIEYNWSDFRRVVSYTSQKKAS